MLSINDFFVKKGDKPIREHHVIVANSESGDTIIHIWKGDNIDTADSLKISDIAAMKLRDALIAKFGV